MRMTNTEPWWKEFDRKVTCTGHTYTKRATIRSPAQYEDALVHTFLDWDTRQDYYVVLPYNFWEHMDSYKREERVRGFLKIYWNLLSPDVRIIVLDKDQRLRAVSSNPEEFIGFPNQGINTLFSYFPWPQLGDSTELTNLPVIRRSRLIEIDRPAPKVDVMEDTRNGERIVVKWLLIAAHHHTWREMFTLKSIPPHPHISPLQYIVMDDDCHRIVGWASKYVDGPDLEIDKSQFKMKWLRQLTETLDYLHLDLGILHGDLQLKNILLDKAKDKVLLIDFEYATAMDEKQLQWEFNRLTWSVYEIITHDMALVEEKLYGDDSPDDEDSDALYACDPTIINEMSEWPVRTNLDCESEEIRRYLQSWIQRRKASPMTTPKNPIRIRTDTPKPSAAVKQKRLDQTFKFEEMQKLQREQQKKRGLLTAGEVRWGRPPFATAYPGRAQKAGESSTSWQSLPKTHRAVADTQGGAEKKDERLLARVEEGPPRKKAKLSHTPAVESEDVVCANQYVKSKAIETSTPPSGSIAPNTSKTSDGA